MTANNKGRLATLFFIIFFDSLAYFLIIPVLLRLLVNLDTSILPANTSMHMRDLIYGVAIMLSPLAFLITSPVAGFISDRYGRRFTLYICLACSLVGFLMPIIGIKLKSLLLILLGRFIAGGSTSSQPVAQAAIIDVSTGAKKAFYLSMIAFAMTLAMVLGPFFGGYLSDGNFIKWFNVMTPYWFGVALSIVNFGLLLFCLPNEPAQKPLAHKPSVKEMMKRIADKRILLLLGIFLLFEIAWSLYYQVIFLYFASQFHYATAHIGWFTTYIGIWMSLGLTFIYRAWLKYCSVENILLWSLLIAAIGFLGINFTSIPLGQWIFTIPMAICIGTAYPSLIAVLSNNSANETQGTVMGAASTIMATAWMITAFASGALFALNPNLPFLIATVSIVLSIIILILLGSRGKVFSIFKSSMPHVNITE